MNRYLVISVLAVGLSTLTACSTHKNNGAMPTTSESDYSGASTYGLPGESGYQGNERAFFKNPMRAPANQVYYFPFDSTQMRSEDLEALRIQANYLVSHRNAKIRLEGNTDNRGSREYNVGLGWRRDQAVARLLEQWGVGPSQIQMVSYGKERPVLDENTDRAWALNRRVNLVYKVTS